MSTGPIRSNPTAAGLLPGMAEYLAEEQMIDNLLEDLWQAICEMEAEALLREGDKQPAARRK